MIIELVERWEQLKSFTNAVLLASQVRSQELGIPANDDDSLVAESESPRRILPLYTAADSENT